MITLVRRKGWRGPAIRGGIPLIAKCAMSGARARFFCSDLTGPTAFAKSCPNPDLLLREKGD